MERAILADVFFEGSIFVFGQTELGLSDFLFCNRYSTGVIHRIHEPILCFHVFGRELDGFQDEMMNSVIVIKLCQDGQQLVDHADVFRLVLGRYADEPMVIARGLEHSTLIELDCLLQQINLVGNWNILLHLFPNGLKLLKVGFDVESRI